MAYRPRFLTLIVPLVTAALLILANLTDETGLRDLPPTSMTSNGAEADVSNIGELEFDVRPARTAYLPMSSGASHLSKGWPLLWNQYVIRSSCSGAVVECCYSTIRLVTNVAIWLVLLIVPAGACEWLLRRYRPRMRFSLRTMLVATALFAALFGWFVWARDRAQMEDALIDTINCNRGQARLRRFGPEWLDVFGADRYRRRIAAVTFWLGPAPYEDEVEESVRSAIAGILRRLSRSPHLDRLNLHGDFTPDIAAAVGELRQLRMLSVVGCQHVTHGATKALAESLRKMPALRVLSISPQHPALGWHADECHKLLLAISNARHLERLHLSNTSIRAQSLTCLAGLNDLRALHLGLIHRAPCEDDPPGLLRWLPELPRLEHFDIHGWHVADDDLRYLARLPRLRSLRLVGTKVTGKGLANLEPLDRLEELSICGQVVSPEGLQSLARLKHLEKLHIDAKYKPDGSTVGTLSLEPHVEPGELQSGRRAIKALRQARPAIEIDGNWFVGSWEEIQTLSSAYDTRERVLTSLAREAVKKGNASGRSTLASGGPGS